MLCSKKNYVALPLFAMLAVILGSSCGKDKPADKVRVKETRAVTIINKTDSDAIYFRISIANSGTIFEGDKTIKVNEMLSREIPPAYENDPKLEVLLIDCHNRVYAKDFQVPLKGNTDAAITEKDRKSEGWFKDRWKDFEKILTGKC